MARPPKKSPTSAIVSKTLEGRITSWNPAAQKMFGWTPGEAIGKQITLIIPPDRHAEEQTVLARVRQGDVVEHFETVRMRKDGTLLDVSLTVSPIKDATGTVVGASKIARAITERRKVEARFRGFLEAAPDAVVIVDQKGLIVVVNSQTEILFGHARGQLVGQPVETLVPPRFRG